MTKAEVIVSPDFQKDAKPFAKKYASFADDLDRLIDELEQNPTKGDNLGSNLYKVRLGIDSKGGGKSGGLRVITYHIQQVSNRLEVHLLTVYDKSEEATIKKPILRAIVNERFPDISKPESKPKALAKPKVSKKKR
jgi:hypothetical protein